MIFLEERDELGTHEGLPAFQRRFDLHVILLDRRGGLLHRKNPVTKYNPSSNQFLHL